jgi:hypothetical protein
LPGTRIEEDDAFACVILPMARGRAALAWVGHGQVKAESDVRMQ